MDTTYNGWTNRETWTMNLWLTNDTAYYDLLEDIVHRPGTNEARAVSLERLLRDMMEDEVQASGMWSDALLMVLTSINWVEIVDNNR